MNKTPSPLSPREKLYGLIFSGIVLTWFIVYQFSVVISRLARVLIGGPPMIVLGIVFIIFHRQLFQYFVRFYYTIISREMTWFDYKKARLRIVGCGTFLVFGGVLFLREAWALLGW